MNNVEQAILVAYARVLENSDIEGVPNLDCRIGRDPGLDSLGIVNLVFEIEDTLNLSLDSVISSIRDSKTLRDVAFIVSNVPTGV